MLLGCLEQCLVFAPLSLGIFLSFYILKITDLTVDGSFVLGAVIYGVCLKNGVFLPLALLCGAFAGGFAGLISAFLQNRDRIPSLLAGILVSFSLYSFNLLILGRPNLGLSDFSHIKDFFPEPVVGYIIITLFSYAFILTILHSPLGLYLRAYGANPKLLRSMSAKDETFRRIGLFLSNALAALSGALTSDLNDYVDCSMGQGLVLIGIGTVVIGLQLLPKKAFSPLGQITAAAVLVYIGVSVYFSLMMGLMRVGIDPFHLKLALGIFLAGFMYFTGKPSAAGRMAS